MSVSDSEGSRSGKSDSESDPEESRGNGPPLSYYKLSGHPFSCSVVHCDSKLFNITAASVH